YDADMIYDDRAYSDNGRRLVRCRSSIRGLGSGGTDEKSRSGMKVQPSLACTCRCLTGLIAAAAAAPVLCEDAGTEAGSRWEIGIAMGYGERTYPLVQSDDIDIL